VDACQCAHRSGCHARLIGEETRQWKSDGNDVVSWPDRSANPKSCNATERCVGADHGQIVVRMQRDHLRLEPSRRIGTHGHALTAVHDMAVRDDVAISGNDEPGTARVRSGATDATNARPGAR